MMYSYISLLSWLTGFKTLNEGQKVTFDVEADPKNSSKMRAVNVHVVG